MPTVKSQTDMIDSKTLIENAEVSFLNGKSCYDLKTVHT